MTITYSGRSKPSALAIARAGGFSVVRGSEGDVNWGRQSANTILNPDISNATNKRVMRELFAEHNVPMPKLFSNSEVSLMFNQNRLIPTMVGRPDQHTKGRGFWKVNSESDFYRALRGTRKKRAATHFMEFIDAPHELRVHIFKGKSIRISEKAHTAFHIYTTIKPTVNVKYVREAAKQAVEALGLDFGTVDVLADEDGKPYVLEVNTAPGVGGSMPQLWADTFNKWYEEEE